PPPSSRFPYTTLFRSEIDLRVRPEDVRAAGADSDDDGIPLKDDVDVARRLKAPRYDPETGELIRPLELKPDPDAEPIDPRSIPVDRKSTRLNSSHQII